MLEALNFEKNHTLMLRFPVSLKKRSMERMLVTVRTVEYAAALPKQSRMTSVYTETVRV